MSVVQTVDDVLYGLIEWVGVDRVVAPGRAVRAAKFGTVGLSGATINTAIFLTAVTTVHYLLAGALAFVAAVTWNFSWNWLITFKQPEGELHRQYLQFVAVSLGGFAIYSGTLAVCISGLGLPPLAANLLGIVTSGLWNFLGADEFAFDDTATLGEKAATSLNRAAHLLYRGPLKRLVRGTWAYHLAFGLYCRLFNAIASDTHHLTVTPGGRLYTEEGAEAVSIHHTVRKERPVLEAFAADISRGDIVWDVGANLGVFSVVAARAGGKVVAIEPYPPTADRIHDNARLSNVADSVTVAPVALGDTSGQVKLGVERPDLGTQTPTLGGEDMRSSVSVPVCIGDETAGDRWPAPDVIKIDVEGAEADVLSGLTETLKGVRVLYVEAHSGWELGALTQMLELLGFDVKQLHKYDSERYLRAVRR